MRNRFVPSGASGGGGNPSWDDLTDKPSMYSYFVIWAEESGDLGNGAYEWAFGNGNDTPAGMGVVVPFDCELIAVGLTLEGAASCEVEVRRNTATTGKSASTANSKKGWSNFENDPVSFSAGDVVGFRTITGHANSNAGVIAAWFRRAVA